MLNFADLFSLQLGQKFNLKIPEKDLYLLYLVFWLLNVSMLIH